MSDDVTNPLRRVPTTYRPGTESRPHLYAVTVDPEAPPAPDKRPQDPGAPTLPPESPGRGGPRWPGRGGGGEGQPSKPRLRKLRFFLILLGLTILALVSTAFGMMMAVASDIPQIENQREYKTLAKNSYLYDDHRRPIGPFLAPDPEVIDTWSGKSGISPAAVHAVVAVEDKRFWSDPGVDLRGIVRAFMSDITGGPTQGGSTITEQFVKNALQQQGNRTILEKLREAALAFHLTHKWKRSRILTAYLNSVSFGKGESGRAEV
jgi:penicillin-binding protein 1A